MNCSHSSRLTHLKGPVTTTFTPAPSCSGPYAIEIGLYDEAFAENGTDATSTFQFYGTPCANTLKSRASCIPSGSLVDSQLNAYISTHSGAPNTQFKLNYYSPGFICPFGYSTVGIATKSTAGAISSSGPAFVPSDVEVSGEDSMPNVLLQNLLEGESAVLCCPRFATRFRNDNR